MQAAGEMANQAVFVIRLLTMSNSTTSDVSTIAHTASKIIRQAILISVLGYAVKLMSEEENVWADMLTRWQSNLNQQSVLSAS